MKIKTKNSVIAIEEEEDDDDFLSHVAAVEANALASKRRRITPSGNAVVSASHTIPKQVSSPAASNDGVYLTALKGNPTLVRQPTASDPLGGRLSKARGLKVVDSGNDDVLGGGGGGSGSDSCFKCGKSGHWARDCDGVAGGGGGGHYGNYGGGGGDDPTIPEKNCPCGLGICMVLTANTEKNRGRKFYKCPIRQENGGCGFFEWCDNVSGANNSMARSDSSSYPGLQCPCGAGLCMILTAKTGNNIGQQFYRCPANQGSSCGFFKWCNEQTASVGRQFTASKVSYNSSETNNTSYNVRTGSSCFKCGKDGHWARDCSVPSSNPKAEFGGRSASTSASASASSGTCYKCGKPGHWSRDCTFC